MNISIYLYVTLMQTIEYSYQYNNNLISLKSKAFTTSTNKIMEY